MLRVTCPVCRRKTQVIDGRYVMHFERRSTCEYSNVRYFPLKTLKTIRKEAWQSINRKMKCKQLTGL